VSGRPDWKVSRRILAARLSTGLEFGEAIFVQAPFALPFHYGGTSALALSVPPAMIDRSVFQVLICPILVLRRKELLRLTALLWHSPFSSHAFWDKAPEMPPDGQKPLSGQRRDLVVAQMTPDEKIELAGPGLMDFDAMAGQAPRRTPQPPTRKRLSSLTAISWSLNASRGDIAEDSRSWTKTGCREWPEPPTRIGSSP